MNISQKVLLSILTTLLVQSEAIAFDWTVTEVHYQYGKLDIPYTGTDTTDDISTYTLQHANGWKYGDNYVFIDQTEGDVSNKDLYSEGYAGLSLGKISSIDLSCGPLKDIAFIGGYNWGESAKFYKVLVGMRFVFQPKGFSFINLDIVTYNDRNKGVEKGGAPKEGDSFQIDVNWVYGFSIKEHDFGVEGHIEYIDERLNSLGQKSHSHILAQPQIRYDLGKTLGLRKQKLFVGIEYQYWNNKLGDPNTDESAIQFLGVFRL
jgi:nucleoside-specific outer membrane channel protein Tsx